ncbi:MAG: hypothetical protein ACTS73_07495 [Arsenophonus sp. NEOnobi-MAG3]
MICHEKVYLLQVFTKLDISCDPLHKFICNGASRHLIATVVEVELEAC